MMEYPKGNLSRQVVEVEMEKKHIILLASKVGREEETQEKKQVSIFNFKKNNDSFKLIDNKQIASKFNSPRSSAEVCMYVFFQWTFSCSLVDPRRLLGLTLFFSRKKSDDDSFFIFVDFLDLREWVNRWPPPAAVLLPPCFMILSQKSWRRWRWMWSFKLTYYITSFLVVCLFFLIFLFQSVRSVVVWFMYPFDLNWFFCLVRVGLNWRQELKSVCNAWEVDSFRVIILVNIQ